MSKYEDLCKTYAKAKRDYIVSQRDVINFAGKLIHGIINYFGIPSGEITVIPINDYDEKRKYNIATAVEIWPDSYWHFGIIISLFINPDDIRRENLMLHIAARKVDEVYVLKIGKLAEEFHIHPNDGNHYRQFYDQLFTIIKESYEKNLRYYPDEGETTKEIGT